MLNLTYVIKLQEKCTTIKYTISTFLAQTASTAGTFNYTCRKVHPRTEEVKVSSILSLTSALDGQRHAPAALPPVKSRYPLYRRLGGPQGRSVRVRKISLPPGFGPRTVQPVASRYTDCAIPAHLTPAVLRQSHSCPRIHHDDIQRKRKYSSTRYKPRQYTVV